MTELADKHDEGKLRIELVPVSAIQSMAEVLTHGAKKYGENGWRLGLEFNRMYGAAMRHLVAWQSGEDLDKESGLSHLSHALCCVAFLNEWTTTHPELDNRLTHGKK